MSNEITEKLSKEIKVGQEQTEKISNEMKNELSQQIKSKFTCKVTGRKDDLNTIIKTSTAELGAKIVKVGEQTEKLTNEIRAANLERREQLKDLGNKIDDSTRRIDNLLSKEKVGNEVEIVEAREQIKDEVKIVQEQKELEKLNKIMQDRLKDQIMRMSFIKKRIKQKQDARIKWKRWQEKIKKEILFNVIGINKRNKLKIQRAKHERRSEFEWKRRAIMFYVR